MRSILSLTHDEKDLRCRAYNLRCQIAKYLSALRTVSHNKKAFPTDTVILRGQHESIESSVYLFLYADSVCRIFALIAALHFRMYEPFHYMSYAHPYLIADV